MSLQAFEGAVATQPDPIELMSSRSSPPLAHISPFHHRTAEPVTLPPGLNNGKAALGASAIQAAPAQQQANPEALGAFAMLQRRLSAQPQRQLEASNLLRAAQEDPGSLLRNQTLLGSSLGADGSASPAKPPSQVSSYGSDLFKRIIAEALATMDTSSITQEVHHVAQLQPASAQQACISEVQKSMALLSSMGSDHGMNLTRASSIKEGTTSSPRVSTSSLQQEGSAQQKSNSGLSAERPQQPLHQSSGLSLNDVKARLKEALLTVRVAASLNDDELRRQDLRLQLKASLHAMGVDLNDMAVQQLLRQSLSEHAFLGMDSVPTPVAKVAPPLPTLPWGPAAFGAERAQFGSAPSRGKKARIITQACPGVHATLGEDPMLADSTSIPPPLDLNQDPNPGFFKNCSSAVPQHPPAGKPLNPALPPRPMNLSAQRLLSNSSDLGSTKGAPPPPPVAPLHLPLSDHLADGTTSPRSLLQMTQALRSSLSLDKYSSKLSSSAASNMMSRLEAGRGASSGPGGPLAPPATTMGGGKLPQPEPKVSGGEVGEHGAGVAMGGADGVGCTGRRASEDPNGARPDVVPSARLHHNRLASTWMSNLWGEDEVKKRWLSSMRV